MSYTHDTTFVGIMVSRIPIYVDGVRTLSCISFCSGPIAKANLDVDFLVAPHGVEFSSGSYTYVIDPVMPSINHIQT